MRPSRSLVAVATAAAMALTGAAVAAATPSGELPPPGITVNGSATAPLPDGAGAQQRQSAYSTALAGALDAASAKAAAVAAHEGVTLGALTAIVEQTDVGSTQCAPDVVGPIATSAPAGAHRKPAARRRRRRAHHSAAAGHPARRAGASGRTAADAPVPIDGGCPAFAQVTVTYAIGGPSPVTTTTTVSTTTTH